MVPFVFSSTVHPTSQLQREVDEGTYRKQRRSVLRNFHDLDCRVVAGLDAGVGGQRDLGDADGAWVGVRGGSDDLEGRDHGVAHVLGPAARSVGAVAKVDVHEGCLVALEPTRLQCDGAACCWPKGPITERFVTAACVGLVTCRRG